MESNVKKTVRTMGRAAARGVTLVEVLIVVSIMAVISGGAVVLARHGRAVVDEHARQVEAGGGEQHAGNRLVAPGQSDEPVETFGVHDGFDRVDDDLTGHE